MTTEKISQIRKIAEHVREFAYPRGFALFIGTPGDNFAYVSNGERADVVEALREWIARPKDAPPREGGESDEQRAARLELEESCANIGKVLLKSSDKTKLCLFLFDWAAGGHLAFYSNFDAWPGITRWLHEQDATGAGGAPPETLPQTVERCDTRQALCEALVPLREEHDKHKTLDPSCPFCTGDIT